MTRIQHDTDPTWHGADLAKPNLDNFFLTSSGGAKNIAGQLVQSLQRFCHRDGRGDHCVGGAFHPIRTPGAPPIISMCTLHVC